MNDRQQGPLKARHRLGNWMPAQEDRERIVDELSDCRTQARRSAEPAS